MQAEGDRQVEALFQEAVLLPRAERVGFLRRHCSDESLCRRVERLLRHDEIAGPAFLRGGAEILLPTQLPHPERIGRYRIVSVLGHGGMGTVYEAEQDQPRRIVALKVIRPGWMTPAMLRRFEFEGEVLARLEHPGIARIFDAGAADGAHGPQPYFAMELVQGKRLDDFVREANLSMKDRLRLLIEICQAVHHAHTKGVIHRDLKPSNILITADGARDEPVQPRPKILDFGVARATDSDIQSTTLLTQSGQIIGTLPYMAPEQASGKVSELDTSSDVYALGVIAYELLSGTLPYSLDGKALHEAVRVICEDEPPRLSSVNKSLRGDVETIVGKALEKDKTRRYHTAGELAADVKRYLDYEPITARAPGTWYPISRFAQRNKLLVGGVVILAAVLVGATIISTWQAVRATRAERQVLSEKQRADEQAAVANAVVGFLNGDVLGQASSYAQDDPGGAPKKDLTVREALDRAADRIATRFENQPTIEAAVRNTVGKAYTELADFEKAEPQLQAALQLQRATLGEDHVDTLNTTEALGRLYTWRGRLADAEPLFQRALAGYGKILGEHAYETLTTKSSLGVIYMQQGRYDEAEPLLRETLHGMRTDVGNADVNTMTALSNLADLYHYRRQYDKAEPLYLESLAKSRKIRGDRHPLTLVTLNNLGLMYARSNQYDKAEPLAVEALEGWRKVCGDEHPETLVNVMNLGALYGKQGKLDEAAVLLRQAVDGIRKVNGNEHPNLFHALNELALLYWGQKNYDSAEPLWVEAVAGARKVLGSEHPKTLTMTGNLARLRYQQGDYAEAERMFAELAMPERGPGISADVALKWTSGHGLSLWKLRRLREAEPPLRKAHHLAKSNALPPTSDVVAALADICSATNRPDEAAKWRAELAALEAATQPTAQRN